MEPLYFQGQVHEKLLPSGERKTMDMVFLIYACASDGCDPVIDAEFEACAWVAPDEFDRYDMNEATRITLRQIGVARDAATTMASDSSNP